jgi:hypothetical protein
MKKQNTIPKKVGAYAHFFVANGCKVEGSGVKWYSNRM